MTQQVYSRKPPIERYTLNGLLFHIADPFDQHGELPESEIETIQRFLTAKLEAVSDNLDALQGVVLPNGRSRDREIWSGPITDEYAKLEAILYHSSPNLLGRMLSDANLDIRRGIVQFPYMGKKVSRLGRLAEQLVEETRRKKTKDEGNLADLKKYGVDGHLYVHDLGNDRVQILFKRTKLMGRIARKFADLALEEMIRLESGSHMTPSRFELKRAALNDVGGIQVIESSEECCDRVMNLLHLRLKPEYNIEAKVVTKDKVRCPGRHKLRISSKHIYEEPVRMMVSSVVQFLYDDYFGEAKRPIYCARREDMSKIEFSDGTSRDVTKKEDALREKMLARLNRLLTDEDRRKMNPHNIK